MSELGGLPVLAFQSRGEWATWLADNHTRSGGIWLKLAKKGAGTNTVSYADALEVALCFGWIDGQKGRLDTQYWLQRFTPRTPRSKWSRINRDRATALIASGDMAPAGMQEIEAAQADGRWDDAYEGQRTITIPPDLQAELDKNSEAKAFFASLDSRNRYAILYRIQDAKKPETRARRIKTFVAMLTEHKLIHP
jgi:uncharacterized protein YdeI (YjbR/CyaY-like superfamily)